MFKYWNLIILCFALTSCKSQDKKLEIMEIGLYFYPSSGGDVIYSVDIKDYSLVVKNHAPLDTTKLTDYKGTLSKTDIDSISNFTRNLIYRETFDNEIVLDSWRLVLKVNGRKMYEKTDFSIKDLPKDVKNLVKYLMKISPVEIDLYGFS